MRFLHKSQASLINHTSKFNTFDAKCLDFIKVNLLKISFGRGDVKEFRIKVAAHIGIQGRIRGQKVMTSENLWI